MIRLLRCNIALLPQYVLHRHPLPPIQRMPQLHLPIASQCLYHPIIIHFQTTLHLQPLRSRAHLVAAVKMTQVISLYPLNLLHLIITPTVMLVVWIVPLQVIYHPKPPPQYHFTKEDREIKQHQRNTEPRKTNSKGK